MKTSAAEEKKTRRAREWAQRHEKPLLQVPNSGSSSSSSDSSSSSSGSDKEGEHKENEHKQPPITSLAQVPQEISWAMLKSSGRIHVRVDLGVSLEEWTPICNPMRTYGVQETAARGDTLCTAEDNLVGKGAWCKRCCKFAYAEA